MDAARDAMLAAEGADAGTATPGGLAALYYAYCGGCGATYPSPFRVPSATGRRQAGPSPQTGITAGQEADAA